jgi:hypothetical protein
MIAQPLHVLVDNSDKWTTLGASLLGGFFALAGVIVGLILERWLRRRGRIKIIASKKWSVTYQKSGAVSIGASGATHGELSFEFDILNEREQPFSLREIHCELRFNSRKWDILIVDRDKMVLGPAPITRSIINTITVLGLHMAHCTAIGLIGEKDALMASASGELYIVALDSDGSRIEALVPKTT